MKEVCHYAVFSTASQRQRGKRVFALIERNLRLVAYIAKKYAAPDKDMDDLISIGTIGLIKAVDSFDESKKYGLPAMPAGALKMNS